MKVLFLTHRVPYPPDRGDRIRSYHLLRFLAARADVSLACTNEEPVSSPVRQHLETICERIEICPTSAIGRARRSAWSLARGRSATEGYFWNPQLATTVDAWSRRREFDVVICYCSGMYRYTRLPCLAQVPVVVDLVDVDSQKWKACAQRARFPPRWLYNTESQRVRQLEREIAEHASAITVISEEEQTTFAQVATHAEVNVVPNGVDHDFFRPRAESSAVAENTCCFVGVLNYRPNVDGLHWFIDSVWPRVRNAVPSARFTMVGKSPNAAARQLARAPGVELHAGVPDVRPFLSRARVIVVPLQVARGVQNKVLEAMAMKKPVVVTPTARVGLRARSGVELIEADTSEDWVAAITGLLRNKEWSDALGGEARDYVERNHRWDSCLQPFAEILQRATAKANSSETRSQRSGVASRDIIGATLVRAT